MVNLVVVQTDNITSIERLSIREIKVFFIQRTNNSNVFPAQATQGQKHALLKIRLRIICIWSFVFFLI